MPSAVATDLARLVGAEHVRHDAHFLADAPESASEQGCSLLENVVM